MNIYEKRGWGQDSSCPQSEDETPINHLESHSCTKAHSNSRGIKFVQKSGGGGFSPAKSHLLGANMSPPQKGSPQEALFAGDKEQLRAGNNVELFAVYKGAAGAAKLDSDLSQPAVYVDFHARDIRRILRSQKRHGSCHFLGLSKALHRNLGNQFLSDFINRFLW